MKKTLILGASLDSNRYANKAMKLMVNNGLHVVGIGIRKGNIEGAEIITEQKPFERIHTISIYLHPRNHISYYQYIIDLKPKRVIFNPGSENKKLEDLLRSSNIPFEHSCSIVLLNLGKF